MARIFLLLFFLPFLWISCSDDQFDIGRDNIDVKSKISFIDTLTVSSYTVMLDSVPTSSLDDPAATIGKYTDPEFGTIAAGSFFTVTLPAKVTAPGTLSKYGIPNEAVFDSIRLYLIYNSYYEGDTTVPFTIDVHRLTQKIKAGPNGYFFNNDSVAASPEIFGQKTFIPAPKCADTVWIPIDPVFGSEMFNMMKENDVRATDAEYFEDFFRGFMVTYHENNNSIIGFHFPKAAATENYPTMRIYYHYDATFTTQKFFDFKADPELQFNRFNLMDKTVPFPETQKQKLPASLTGNDTYVRAGIGILTRFEIPYLRNLFFLGNNIQLLKAELEVEPAKNTYTEETLPTSVSLFTTDNLNRFGDEILYKPQTPALIKLNIDMLNQEETKYIFEITNFIKSSLNEQTDEIPAMLLTISPEDLYKTSRRLILGSQHNKFNKIKLKLYYMNIE